LQSKIVQFLQLKRDLKFINVFSGEKSVHLMLDRVKKQSRKRQWSSNSESIFSGKKRYSWNIL